MKEIFRKGESNSSTAFDVYGKAHNGEARVISDEITLVGQDVAITLPKYGVAGVFDGSGGATDIGSPVKAALRAARTTQDYYEQGGDNISEAMEVARLAVIDDLESGVCVGALAGIKGDSVKAVVTGDSPVLVFDTCKQETSFITEPQVDRSGQPANYLGRKGRYMPEPIESLKGSIRIPESGGELYVMSGGVFGSSFGATDLQDYHLQAAHDDYLLLQAIMLKCPKFEEEVRRELSGEKARSLLENQITENITPQGNLQYYSSELVDPGLFTLGRMDWEVWYEIVKPMARKLDLSHKLGSKAILKGLVQRPIEYESIRPRVDDATVVYARLS